tara:strand:+ start:523 stop:894 length:372 start_codon:yes stop_codon:yes gene_type:complete
MRSFFVSVAIASIVMTSNIQAQDGNPEIELVRQPCDPGTSARVFVAADGTVSLNRAVVAVEALPAALKKLQPTINVVCYSRENPEAFEPHPAALEALDAITELRLPVALYWDAGFQQRVHFKQ